MHLSIELLLVVMAFLGRAVVSNQPPADDCLRLCGNVNIPYPFGLEERCSYNNDFLVACNRSSSGGPKLTLGNSNVIVTNINTTTSEIEVMAEVAYNCYNSSGPYERTMPEEEYYGSFSISNKNKGFVIGCDTYGIIVGKKRNGKLIGGTCLSTCDSDNDITDGSCSGAGCCDVTIHNGTSSSGMALHSFNNHSDILKWNPCSYAFIVTEGKYKFSKTDLLNFGGKGMTMPRLLNWAIGNKSTCDTIDKESDDFLCKGNYTECDQDYDGSGYRCRCLKGYDGNPYIKDNCKNINECDRGIHDCVHDCIDTEGSFNCSCDKGYFGDGRKGEGGTGCTKDQPSTNLTLVIEIALCK